MLWKYELFSFYETNFSNARYENKIVHLGIVTLFVDNARYNVLDIRCLTDR